MRFKELTDEQKAEIIDSYRNRESIGTTVEKLAIELGIKYGSSERTIRKWFKKLDLPKKNEPEPEVLEIAKTKEHDKSKKYYLVTWAQNATKVNEGFFDNLKRYAEFIDAEILVIPGRYHNYTNPLFDNKNDYENNEWWDPKVMPYLTLNRHNLNKNLCILSDVPVQPTASNPLTSLESLLLGESGIVGHSRVHLKTLPVLDVKNPRIMMSTGSCTVKNFSLSKVGKVSEFHHTLGAVIVEIKNDEEFFMRQITADDKTGNFCDLYYEVSKKGVNRIKNCLAIVKGDIHYGNHDENVIKKSFDCLIPKINPNEVYLHDLFDARSINLHESNNFIRLYQKEVVENLSLKQEINDMLNWLEKIKHLNLVVVFSNHDDMLTRFIINSDVKKNIKNALEYMEYAKVLLEGKAPDGLIPYIIRNKFDNIRCLGRNENYKINDWILSIHGMDGVNGSRGGVQQYRKLNSKVISGHSHSPCRLDGSLSVGCNTKLFLNYNNGPSTWAHADVILHNNNKAQHVFYDSNGDYTTLE